MEEELTCTHCGHKGAVRTNEYLGGHGYTEFTICQDRIACWQRWDKQHGLRGSYDKKATV